MNEFQYMAKSGEILGSDSVISKIGDLSRKSESAGYAKGLFQLMEDLTQNADDTMWLMNNETVFERCWMIIEQQEGRARLEERFPEYA